MLAGWARRPGRASTTTKARGLLCIMTPFSWEVGCTARTLGHGTLSSDRFSDYTIGFLVFDLFEKTLHNITQPRFAITSTPASAIASTFRLADGVPFRNKII